MMTYSNFKFKTILLAFASIFIFSNCQKETQVQPGEIVAKEIKGTWSQISYIFGGVDKSAEVLGRTMTFIPDLENPQEGRYEHIYITGGRTKGQYAVSITGEKLFINGEESEIDIDGQVMTLESTARDRRGRIIETESTYLKIN